MSSKRDMVRVMVAWFNQAGVAEAQLALNAIRGVMDGKAPKRPGAYTVGTLDERIVTGEGAPVKARRGRKPKAAETQTEAA